MLHLLAPRASLLFCVHLCSLNALLEPLRVLFYGALALVLNSLLKKLVALRVGPANLCAAVRLAEGMADHFEDWNTSRCARAGLRPRPYTGTDKGRSLAHWCVTLVERKRGKTPNIHSFQI